MQVKDSIGSFHEVPDYIWVPKPTLAGFKAEVLTSAPTTVKRPTPNFPNGDEQSPNTDPEPIQGKACKQVPHPQSDFSHVDPNDPYFVANPAVYKNSPGYRRLEAVYTQLLDKLARLLDEFSKISGQSDFDIARDNYIKFVEDLDDHEPEKGRGVFPGKQGYGKVIKWFSIQPTKAAASLQITALTFVVKWNPHSSSSAIKVP